MSFRHTPLSTPTCIRTVNISPADNDDAALVCSLEEIDIINGTSYHAFSALSYRWGNGTRPQKITLNGFDVRIGRNLFDFLIHARRSMWTRHLWIDALSINQDDSQEKEQQVLRMCEIYSLASNVLIWLGEMDGDEVAALNEIQDVLGDPATATAMQQYMEEMPSGQTQHHYTFFLTKRCQRGLVKLLLNPYWLRKWIVQEVLLGGSNASIIVSEEHGGYIPITTIAPVVHTLIAQTLKDHEKAWADGLEQWCKSGQEAQWFRYPPPNLSQDEAELWCLRALLGARDYKPSCESQNGIREFWKTLSSATSTYKPLPLARLVEAYQNHQCAEKDDQVFAMLGLAIQQPGERIELAYQNGITRIYENPHGRLERKHAVFAKIMVRDFHAK